ncbi:hypothetical protein MSAN_00161300 [Mycena sanguinolenta]|uniref:Uncharacterized protein n=1 Tax=Mycena sanguinolenta TaxID=230812 RepID=A0A8H7DL26_9AGAR|nr:hypothetical protein MSAN_00161300 [Mycena sanguinolenta]
MSTSWTPDETAAQLWNERCIFIGQFIGAFGYGVHLTLFVQCVHALYSGRKTRRHNWELLLFIFILFALGNIGNATSIFYAQKTFIDDRNYPGGPGAYFFEQSTQWVAVLCNSVYIVNTWFQDGLLLYRFWTIYSRNYYIAVVPALMFLTSLILSAIVIVILNRPGNTFWTALSVKLAIPYWAISISMTVILTALIAGRLMFMRYRLKKLVGASSSMPYVTITAMLVESAAIYSINGIIFLVTYGLNDPTQNLWLPVLGQTQSIAPLLIILRVARGQAFTGATVDQLTSMRFGRSQATRTTNDGSTTVLDTFRSGRKNVRMGSHQDLEQKEDGGETESEFRVAVV